MLSHDDRIFEIPPLSADDMEKDFIPVPMPKMGIVSRVKQAGLQVLTEKKKKKKKGLSIFWPPP